MGKNLEPQYAFRCDEITIKKLEYIAKRNTRTRNQEMKHLIKEYIEQYEKENGTILVEDIKSRKEAMETQKETLRNRNENGVLNTLKDSFKNGLDMGKATK